MVELIKLSLLNCTYQEKYRKLFWENKVFQSTWMLVKFFLGLIFNLFVYFLAMREPTDKDIVDYVENTTLSLLVTSGQDGNFLKVKNCKLVSSTVLIQSISLQYTKNGKGDVSIHKFHLNGEIINSRTLIFEILFFYHVGSFHTKLHLYSNNLTEYIVDKNIDFLEPSTKTSIPLHLALTRSALSPIQDEKIRTTKPWKYKYFSKAYSVDITRESLIEESMGTAAFFQSIPISSHKAGYILRFPNYLADAKGVVFKAISSTNLPLELLDALFCHIVLHAVDHSRSYAHSRRLKFGSGGFLEEPSRFSLFRSLMFRWQMVKPGVNPMRSNKIKELKSNKFYGGIYDGLRKLDDKYGVEFADVVTASVMY